MIIKTKDDWLCVDCFLNELMNPDNEYEILPKCRIVGSFVLTDKEIKRLKK